MSTKYVNPFTDFGFKKIFGEEASKPMLVDFLNSLLPASSYIKNLSFKNSEQLGHTSIERGAIFDIYCKNDKDENFIVELQKAKQNYFKERMVYYSTFPIREEGEKGDWDFNLKAVFCIGILDFTFDDYDTEAESRQVLHEIKLKNQQGKTFYEKLTYIYLEMPNFNKSESELETRLDKWLYFIKHLEDFQNIPEIFKNEVVFVKALEKAELAKLDRLERDGYEHSLKVYRDLKNVIDYANIEGRMEGEMRGRLEGIELGKAEGKAEGKLETQIEIARTLKQNGISIEIISTSTGLSAVEINKL